MKFLNGLAFLITLAIAAAAWALYSLEPGLLLGTPWGHVHLVFLILGAFVLGLAVMGLYVLAGWLYAQAALRKRYRELRQVQAELEALRREHPQETPVIPDRLL